MDFIIRNTAGDTFTVVWSSEGHFVKVTIRPAGSRRETSMVLNNERAASLAAALVAK